MAAGFTPSIFELDGDYLVMNPFNQDLTTARAEGTIVFMTRKIPDGSILQPFLL